MFGRRIEAQRPHGCVEFGDQFVELLVARPETFVPAEAPLTAVDDAYPLAAMAAERPVLDEPKAIGSASTFRASEQRPGPAVPEPDVRQADQLLPVANLDDRVRRVELHHARRAQARDFHAQELVEEPSAVGVLASHSHDDGKASAAATPSANARHSARSRAGL
jgi:hypothetical protein